MDDFLLTDLLESIENEKEALLTAILNLNPIKDKISFKETIEKTAKGEEKWEDLFNSEEDVITFVRQNVVVNEDSLNKFIEKQKNKGFNEEQIKYVKELFVFIFKNGTFSRQDMIDDSLNYWNEMFNSVEINSLLEDVEEII